MPGRRSAILLAVLPVPAAAGQARAGSDADARRSPAHASPADASPANTSPANTSMMQGMERMQHEMDAVPMTGDPDRDFVGMMIPHHRGAVAMAWD